MATLYVTEPGSRLEKEYQRLRVVDREGKSLLVTPLARVSEVVLVGRAGATTPAMLALLEAGVGLTLLTRAGKLRGRLTPPTGKNLPLRQKQYALAGDSAARLRLGKAIVRGKLRNSRVMARRMLYGKRDITAPPGQLERLQAALKAVPGCADIPALMGVEGRGAKAYFAIFRAALRQGLVFGPRTRRPPADPVNALLSLGYSLLAANLTTALEIVGLDPYCGYFHANAYGRPALALDLMEEFRPIVADSVALTLINNQMLDANDFEAHGDGYYLTRRGLRAFFEAYTRRLNTTIHHPLAGRPLSYQKIFEVQARQLAKVIQAQIDDYPPFAVR
jgi:CRISPR-associated protein Cas1